MNKQIEALKKLHNSIHGQYYLGQDEEQKLIDVIYKEALAEAEKQEPVAIVMEDSYGYGASLYKRLPLGTKLYTHPAPAEKQEPVTWLSTESKANEIIKTNPATWQSLSDDEMVNLYNKYFGITAKVKKSVKRDEFIEFARAIEQTLKEKNAPNN